MPNPLYLHRAIPLSIQQKSPRSDFDVVTFCQMLAILLHEYRRPRPSVAIESIWLLASGARQHKNKASAEFQLNEEILADHFFPHIPLLLRY